MRSVSYFTDKSDYVSAIPSTQNNEWFLAVHMAVRKPILAINTPMSISDPNPNDFI